MLTELRDLIAQSAAVTSRPLDTRAVMRRGRRLRWRRRLIVASISAAVGAAVLITVPGLSIDRGATGRTAPAAGATASHRPDYSISGVELTSREAGSAEVAFSLAWETNEFPGIRNCTITAYDSAGNVVGVETLKRVYKMTPGVGTLKKDVAVSRTPSDADVTCGNRLDDPTGRYQISDVRFNRPTQESHELLLSFDSSWIGVSDVPGIATCEVTIHEGGKVVLEDQMSFSTEAKSATNTELSLTLPADFRGAPSSVDINCSPLTGV